MMALKTYTMSYEKITLVQGTAADPGMSQLGLRRVTFPDVFRPVGHVSGQSSTESSASKVPYGVCWDDLKVSNTLRSSRRKIIINICRVPALGAIASSSRSATAKPVLQPEL
jgi:hypothetical protein